MQFQMQANLTYEQFCEYWYQHYEGHIHFVERQVIRFVAEGLSFKQARNVVRKDGYQLDDKYLSDVYSQYVEFCKPQTLTISVERPDFDNGAEYYYNRNSCLWDDEDREDAVLAWMNDERSYAILVRNASGVTLGRAWAWFDNEEKTAFNPYGLNDKIWENIFTKMGMENTVAIYPLDNSLYMNDRRVHSNSNREYVIMNWIEDEYVFDCYSKMFVSISDLVEVYVNNNVTYTTASYNSFYSKLYDFRIHSEFAKTAILPDNTWSYVFKHEVGYDYVNGRFIYTPLAKDCGDGYWMY